MYRLLWDVKRRVDSNSSSRKIRQADHRLSDPLSIEPWLRNRHKQSADLALEYAATLGLGRSAELERFNTDRRRTRYIRLRKAIADGLAQPNEVKRKQRETEAADPALDEMALMRRRR